MPLETRRRFEGASSTTRQHQRAGNNMKAGRRKGRKVGKPRGKTCRWSAELDEVLKIYFFRGCLRAARRAIRQHQPTWSWYSVKKRAAALDLCRRRSSRWTDTEKNHLIWS